MHAIAQGNPSSEGAWLYRETLRRRVTQDFGGVITHLRARDTAGVPRAPAFLALERGPWQLWQAIAAHWRHNEESWPSQKRLAEQIGAEERSVRAWTSTLEIGGFLRKRTVRLRDGADHLYYAPGPVTLDALEAWEALYPKGESPERRPPRLKAVQRISFPEEVADPIAAEPVKPKDLNFLPQAGPTSLPPPAVAGEVFAARPSGTEQDKVVRDGGSERSTPSTPATSSMHTARAELAREALAYRHRKKHPDMALPRIWLASDVAMVVACLDVLPGDVDAQRELLRDAIDGSLRRSHGFPALSYTFGTVEHAIEHAARGKRARLARAARANHAQVRLEHVSEAAEQLAPVPSLAELLGAAKLEI